MQKKRLQRKHTRSTGKPSPNQKEFKAVNFKWINFSCWWISMLNIIVKEWTQKDYHNIDSEIFYIRFFSSFTGCSKAECVFWKHFQKTYSTFGHPVFIFMQEVSWLDPIRVTLYPDLSPRAIRAKYVAGPKNWGAGSLVRSA